MEHQSDMNRRSFIGATALSVVMAHRLAAEEQRRFRVGIIGSTGRGNYGHGLDVVWKQVPAVEVAAVADDNSQGLAAALKRTGAARGYADYRKMLDKEKLDLIAVCPRWMDQHHAMLLECAAHGRHVYMEKPFCRTLEEADEVVGAFEQKGLKLAIAHVNRYRPELPIARRLIKEGRLGKILEVRARGKEDRRGGGEDLWVLGTHLMDLMRALLGEVESCFATVTEDGKPVTRENVRNGNEGIGLLAGDTIDAMYRFRNGITGYFASHRNQGGHRSRFAVRVFGSEGVLNFPSGGPVRVLEDSAWATGHGETQWKPISSVATKEELKARPQGNMAAVLDLIGSIGTERQPISSAYDARAATEMIVAVFESHCVGGLVTFPLENRKNPLGML